MITLSIILAASVALNIFAIWYCRNVLSRLLFISESVENLVDAVEIYRQHLEKVYGLEMYYGDETLKNLLAHTNHLSQELEEYESVYNLIPFADDEEQLTEGEDELENEEFEDDGTP
tara:strand:- start:5865 stop:6215 length:351 start_codon:yes stop_codon:yes gene_type:complete